MPTILDTDSKTPNVLAAKIPLNPLAIEGHKKQDYWSREKNRGPTCSQAGQKSVLVTKGI